MLAHGQSACKLNWNRHGIGQGKGFRLFLRALLLRILQTDCRLGVGFELFLVRVCSLPLCFFAAFCLDLRSTIQDGL